MGRSLAALAALAIAALAIASVATSTTSVIPVEVSAPARYQLLVLDVINGSVTSTTTVSGYVFAYGSTTAYVPNARVLTYTPLGTAAFKVGNYAVVSNRTVPAMLVYAYGSTPALINIAGSIINVTEGSSIYIYNSSVIERISTLFEEAAFTSTSYALLLITYPSNIILLNVSSAAPRLIPAAVLREEPLIPVLLSVNGSELTLEILNGSCSAEEVSGTNTTTYTNIAIPMEASSYATIAYCEDEDVPILMMGATPAPVIEANGSSYMLLPLALYGDRYVLSLAINNGTGRIAIVDAENRSIAILPGISIDMSNLTRGYALNASYILYPVDIYSGRALEALLLVLSLNTGSIPPSITPKEVMDIYLEINGSRAIVAYRHINASNPIAKLVPLMLYAHIPRNWIELRFVNMSVASTVATAIYPSRTVYARLEQINATRYVLTPQQVASLAQIAITSPTTAATTSLLITIPRETITLNLAEVKGWNTSTIAVTELSQSTSTASPSTSSARSIASHLVALATWLPLAILLAILALAIAAWRRGSISRY